MEANNKESDLNENAVNQNSNTFLTEFEEVEGGMYDAYGCYLLPDGCFWDSNGIYFNKDGIDANGGFYDEEFNYQPGPNWNEEYQCYMAENEKEVPLSLQKKLLEGVQQRFEQEYDENKELFRTANKNFDINDEKYYGVESANEIDNENDLIQEWIKLNLIQGSPPKEIDEDKIMGNVEDKSPKKEHQVQDENINPNIISTSFDQINLSTDYLVTPFKTKTSEILKEFGTPAYQAFSVKKVKITTPKDNLN